MIDNIVCSVTRDVPGTQFFHALRLFSQFRHELIYLLQLQLQSYTLQQKIVLRGVMQCCRLVGKGENRLLSNSDVVNVVTVTGLL